MSIAAKKENISKEIDSQFELFAYTKHINGSQFEGWIEIDSVIQFYYDYEIQNISEQVKGNTEGHKPVSDKLKKSLEYVVLGKLESGNKASKDNLEYSAAVFVDIEYPTDESGKQANYLEKDEVLEVINEQLDGSQFIVHNTANSMEHFGRFRLIIPTNTPMTEDEYIATWETIADSLSELPVDESSGEFYRIQGLPVFNGLGTDEIIVEEEGKLLEVVKPKRERKSRKRTHKSTIKEISHDNFMTAMQLVVEKDYRSLEQEEHYFKWFNVLATAVRNNEISEDMAYKAINYISLGEPKWTRKNRNRLRNELRKAKKDSYKESEYTVRDKINAIPGMANSSDNPVKRMTSNEGVVVINNIKVSSSIYYSESKISKVVQAKDVAMSNTETFYYTSEKQAYAKIKMFKNWEILSTNSSTFNYWITHCYEAVYGGVLDKNDINKAVQSIDSHAFFNGLKQDIHVRIAEKDNVIYIDLCNEEREFLEISANGFNVIKDSPVLFRRTPDMAEISKPIYRHKDDYKLLKKYINVGNTGDFNIIIAYILGTFRPRIPKPLLNLIGEAGTGKSLNTRLIRTFIDPAKQKDLLKKEIDENELSTAANSQYLLAFDNMSGISAKGSDLLCVVSTGGAITKRKLYSDTDEIIVDLKKTVILNGIDDISQKQDLVSRTLFIETPPLKDSQKKTETEIWEAFEQDYSYILGSIVNAVSVGLSNKGKDQSSYPRMIDFGRFIQESSSALGWDVGYWKTTYINNQKDGVEQSLESDPFAASIVSMMRESQDKGLLMWRGTATRLLEVLTEYLPEEERRYNQAWPKSNKVKARLRRIAPSLKDVGITWEDARSASERLVVLRIINDG